MIRSLARRSTLTLKRRGLVRSPPEGALQVVSSVLGNPPKSPFGKGGLWVVRSAGAVLVRDVQARGRGTAEARLPHAKGFARGGFGPARPARKKPEPSWSPGRRRPPTRTALEIRGAVPGWSPSLAKEGPGEIWAALGSATNQ